jgi:hypothetical protein
MMTHRRLALTLCSALVAFACGPRRVDTVVRPKAMDNAVSCAIHLAERSRFQEWSLGRTVRPDYVRLSLVPSTETRNGPTVSVAVTQSGDSLAVHAVIFERAAPQSPIVVTNARHLAEEINTSCVPARPDSAAH